MSSFKPTSPLNDPNASLTCRLEVLTEQAKDLTEIASSSEGSFSFTERQLNGLLYIIHEKVEAIAMLAEQLDIRN